LEVSRIIDYNFPSATSTKVCRFSIGVVSGTAHSGDKIWTLLCQTAYNLRKFLQLYQNGEIKEQSQIHLGLLA